MPDKINGWISDNTRGKIKKVIGGLNPQTIIIVANAVYFKAFWSQSFSESATKLLPFTGNDGKTVDVPMMNSQAHVKYLEVPGAQIMTLGYRGGSYSMTFVLPDSRVPLMQFIQQLNGDSLARLMRQRQPTRVKYTIPKWTATFKEDLRNVMSQLGMSDVFLTGVANFSNLSRQQSFINLLQHVTFIEVNEKGTEAAAVTVGGGASGGGPKPEEPKIFVANRPFAYFITHDPSGLVCFTGVVNRLEAAKPAEPEDKS